jgi:osmotically-inducible protein OsmY
MRDQGWPRMSLTGVRFRAPRGMMRSCAQSIDDAQRIRKRLLAALNQQSWSNLKLDDIVVQQDVVWLYGTVRDEEERRATIFAASKLPEIKRVESRLRLCVQPFL